MATLSGTTGISVLSRPGQSIELSLTPHYIQDCMHTYILQIRIDKNVVFDAIYEVDLENGFYDSCAVIAVACKQAKLIEDMTLPQRVRFGTHIDCGCAKVPTGWLDAILTRSNTKTKDTIIMDIYCETDSPRKVYTYFMLRCMTASVEAFGRELESELQTHLQKS